MKKSHKKSFPRLKTMIISVVISIVAWIGVVNTVNPDVTETFYDIKIQVNGTAALREKGLVMIDASKLPECSVKVRGKRKDIIDAMNKIYAVINVSDINRQGKSTVEVKINSPSSINLEKQKFSVVDVMVEPCYEKQIPVKIKQSNVIKDKVIKSETKTQYVSVSGSKSDLLKVYGCNVLADLSTVDTDGSTMYPFVYVDEDGTEITKPDTIYCSNINILVENTVYDKSLASPHIEIDQEVYENYRIEYDDEQIRGKNIEIGVSGYNHPKNVVYRLNIDNVKSGQNELTFIADEISDVYIPQREIKLTVSAEPLITEKVLVNITHKNLSSGMVLKSIDDSRIIVLKGTRSELGSVKGSVDLTGLGAGTYNLPLEFDNGAKAVNNETVTVTIGEKVLEQ